MQIIFRDTQITLEDPFILLNSMYGMNNSGKLFPDEMTEWLLESGFIQSQY